jgi:c-di-GMP-binding flagellar brake protein YcgR
MTARTCAASSLSVKYQCPDAARVKLEISPEIQASGKFLSNIRATAWFRAETVSAGGMDIGFSDGLVGIMRFSEVKPVHRAANMSCFGHKRLNTLVLFFK